MSVNVGIMNLTKDKALFLGAILVFIAGLAYIKREQYYQNKVDKTLDIMFRQDERGGGI